MEKPYIMHMFTASTNLSPFDVNMALDAGWTSVIPYIKLDADSIPALVQDAIFSRGPSGVKRTGIFIGGRDMMQSLEMLEAARKSMVPPFEVSVMADPSGAFTTSAGMVAATTGALEQAKADWQGSEVLIAGGTGPVGMACAILAAKLGAKVTIMSRAQQKADEAASLCLELAGGSGEICGAEQASKPDILPQTDVVLATAAAGVEVLSAEDLANAKQLKVAADVNAVPPSGVAGLDVMSGGDALPASASGAVGIGALAIGNIKYQAQHRLLKKMHQADSPVYIHYEDAYQAACGYISEKAG